MDIHTLADDCADNPNRDKTDKVQPVQMQEPSTITIGCTYKPKGHESENDISENAMNPSVEHCTKGIILDGIKIRLYHFPKEVQKKGMKTKTCLRYSENP